MNIGWLIDFHPMGKMVVFQKPNFVFVLHACSLNC